MKSHSTILIFIVFSITVNFLSAQTNHWETAIFANDTWKYFVGNSEPNAFFRLDAFDDRDWKLGKGGIGYGDGDDSTVIEACYSLYMRKPFNVTDTSKISEAILSIDYDDGFVAYINGIEIARSGVIGAYPPYNTGATDHEAKLYAGGVIENFYIPKQLLSKSLQIGINIFSLQVHNSNNGSSDLTAIPYLSFGLTDTTKRYKPTPPWFKAPAVPLADTTETTLPIISISTNGQTIPINNTTKLTATMRVIDLGPGKLNHVSDTANNYVGNIGIEIHGATSAFYPQKSYSIETRDATGANKNTKLLNLPSENDWLLISNYNDKSFARNSISHYMFSSMGHYAPRTRYCEVYVNNEYLGIYLLTEKIKRDNNRVDITKPDPTATSGDKLSGGYIIKNDTRDANEEAFFSPYTEQGILSTNQPIAFLYVDPKASEMTIPQKNYLQFYMQAVEASIYGNNFRDSLKGYRAFLNVISFIDYFIVGEISRSVDAYKKSKFFYKDIDSKSSLLQSGPTWDFDWAYKNIPEGDISKECYYGVIDGSAWAYKSIYCNHSPAFPGWIPRLMQDPYFTNKLKTRYTDLRKNLLNNTNLFRFIDSIQTLLNIPQVHHYKKWNTLGIASQGSPEVEPQPSTFNAIHVQLKNWLTTRLKWLDGNMPGIYDPTTPINNDDPIHFNIFPNPTRSTLYIESNERIKSIAMYSALGVKVNSTVISNHFTHLDVNNLPKGYYFIQTRFENGRIRSDQVIVQ